jgi:chemosensory pili system protein ChpE
VTAEAIRRGLARGFRSALTVEFGSLIGDATWAVIALVGAAFLVQSAVARVTLGVIGTAILVYLGIGALRDSWHGALPKARDVSPRGDFLVGAGMSLTNPLSVAFWLGVGGTAVSSVVASPALTDYVLFFGGFMAACVTWCFVMAGLIASGRRILSPSFFRVVDALCGLGLLYFAARLLSHVLATA